MDRVERLALELFKKDFGEKAAIEDHIDAWPDYVIEASEMLREGITSRGEE